MRFFWDMDGVLYDFDKLFKEVMPGVDMEDDSAWTWQELYARCPDMYSKGDIMPNILCVYDFAGHFGENLILTAIPKRWHWPDACKQKRDWAVRNIGISPERVRFGPFAVDKQFHCTGREDVLIDDRIRNIQQWIEMGGTGILHINPINTYHVLMDLISRSFK